MKKTTYSIIALIALLLVIELVLLLKIRSTGHPRPVADLEYTDMPLSPIVTGSITVEIPGNWRTDLPYGASPDSVVTGSRPYEVDTLIVIAPHGSIRVR